MSDMVTEAPPTPATLAVVQPTGEPAGTVQVGTEFFTAPIKTGLLAQVILAYRANQRAGTASTKTRAAVSGGGKKPWRQKHTGRARAGSIRSPLWRHGGIIFGPHPRDFGYRLPAQMRRAALLEALRAKAHDGELTVVTGLTAERPSTKAMAKLAVLQPQDQHRILVVLERLEPAVYRSLRNLAHVELQVAQQLTAYDLLNHQRVVLTQPAWAIVEARCRG